MTPQGQPMGPVPEKSWFQKYWMWLVGGGCAAAMLCCGLFSLLGFGAALLGEAAEQGGLPGVKALGAEAARVDCGVPGPGGVDCELKRTGGTGSFKACWDLEIACANGSTMVGSACGSVPAGQPGGTVNMPTDAFSHQDGCDTPANGVVKHLTVERQ